MDAAALLSVIDGILYIKRSKEEQHQIFPGGQNVFTILQIGFGKSCVKHSGATQLGQLQSDVTSRTNSKARAVASWLNQSA